MRNHSTTIATIAIQAPCANFVMSTITRTVPVVSERERADRPPPHACAAIGRRRASVRSSRFQCRTMPVWLRVNETNTPTM